MLYLWSGGDLDFAFYGDEAPRLGELDPFLLFLALVGAWDLEKNCCIGWDCGWVVFLPNIFLVGDTGMTGRLAGCIIYQIILVIKLFDTI